MMMMMLVVVMLKFATGGIEGVVFLMKLVDDF